MKTADDGRAYVQKQLPFKPDFIKIWYIALGRNVDSSARVNLPLVQAVIDESRIKPDFEVRAYIPTDRNTADVYLSDIPTERLLDPDDTLAFEMDRLVPT